MTAPAVFWNFEMAWQMFFCSCLGVLSLSILDNLKDGESIVEIVNSGAVKFGTMVTNPWYLWDLPSFMLLGVFGGILGAFFVSGNHFFGKLRNNSNSCNYSHHNIFCSSIYEQLMLFNLRFRSHFNLSIPYKRFR